MTRKPLDQNWRGQLELDITATLKLFILGAATSVALWSTLISMKLVKYPISDAMQHEASAFIRSIAGLTLLFAVLIGLLAIAMATSWPLNAAREVRQNRKAERLEVEQLENEHRALIAEERSKE